MKKSFTVKVTKKIIKKGVPCDSGQCPVALAVKRLDGFGKKTRTCGSFIYSGHRVFKLPKVAFNWVLRFDSGKKMKPIKFKIKRIDS